jgi:hypothetical protein
MVTLTAPAPEGGLVVALSSSDADVAVPDDVTVSSGAQSTTFNLTARPVAADKSVTITASARNQSRTAILEVRPPAIRLLQLEPQSLVLGAGQARPFGVTLTAPASHSGMAVTLSVGHPALMLPQTIVVPPAAVTASAQMRAQPVTHDVSVTITGTAAGTVRTAVVTVVPVYISFVSEVGDYIGQGRSLRVEPTRWTFAGEMWSGNGHLQITASSPSDAADWWQLMMSAPPGQVLAPGVYSDARRSPPIGSSNPALSFAGEGRGCNTSTGSFEVLEASYGPGFGGYSGSIERFRATFRQTCDGSSGELRGEVRLATIPFYCKTFGSC